MPWYKNMAAPLGSCGCRAILPLCHRFLPQHRYVQKSAAYYDGGNQQVSVTGQRVEEVPSPTVPDGSEKIEIPKRIKREPTAILKALAATVARDFNAPRYPFIDDPYLLPNRVIEKRTYMVSKASGKRAAQYVIQNYPNFFKGVFEAEPNIEAFMPTPRADKHRHEESTLEGLEERIAARRPEDAFKSYKLLKEQGTDISQLTYNRLLDLLCACNCNNQPEDALPEEIWALNEGIRHKKREPQPVWSGENNEAEEVFEDMPEKNAWAYSSLIRGMATYTKIDTAFEKLQDMKSNNLQADLDTYNTVIRSVIYMKQNGDAKFHAIVSLLQEMEKVGIKPNDETFNNALYSLSQEHLQMREAKAWVLMVLNEMRECGIEPSLATWCHIMNAHYARKNDGMSHNRILYEIVDYLEDKELRIQHPDDANFFAIAMDKCTFYVKDLQLGYKIDALLNRAGNYGLLSSSITEFNYYGNYLQLLCEYESIEKIIEEYERVFSHACHPTFRSLLMMFDVLELHGAYHYFPKMYSDMVKLSYDRREEMLLSLLNILGKQQHEKPIQDQLIEVVKKILHRAEEDNRLFANRKMRSPLVLSGKMLDNMIIICLNGEDYDGAWNLFEFYKREAKKVEGVIGERGLGRLVSACVKENDNKRALQVLTEMAALGYSPSSDLVKQIMSGLSLEEDELVQLKELFPKTKWNPPQKQS